MRRKPGTLTKIEISILETAMNLHNSGVEEFHGFGIAKEIKDRENARLLIGRGTIYKALRRLELQGILTSRWEDASAAENESRPRRKLYKVTAVGASALARSSVVDTPLTMDLRTVN